jgi:hypothetical protein
MHDFLTAGLNLGWRIVGVKKAKKTKISFGSVAQAFRLDGASIKRDQRLTHKDKAWC